ncbi:MBL fold metallo-hydrolase [uncultured Jatrophihabitans sp.]|uniref:MBL fold metallo-hydrolase n=1 Tax=uncultured Jatrophihabitans sp. TaxID=1610747 RepID=UPI0035C9CBFA
MATTTARLDVLSIGYAHDRVASTCTLVRDGDAVIVIDPGMVANRALLLQPLADLVLSAQEVTDIVISHHHPDHTVNIALFPNAKLHDVMATYVDDLWLDHEPGDFTVSPAVRLVATPGHTDQDVSTIVQTDDGLIVLTHLWWGAQGPAQDPFAADVAVLKASRDQVLALEPALIVPGHGAPFAPNGSTPR